MSKLSRKFRFLSLAMAVAFSMAAMTVDAGSPPTKFYFVANDRACQLPDATGRPQETVVSKVQMAEVAENLVQLDCVGLLPAGSALPESPMKLSFSETKTYCATWYDDGLLLTKAYGATVLPDGTAEISCAFTIHQ